VFVLWNGARYRSVLTRRAPTFACTVLQQYVAWIDQRLLTQRHCGMQMQTQLGEPSSSCKFLRMDSAADIRNKWPPRVYKTHRFIKVDKSNFWLFFTSCKVPALVAFDSCRKSVLFWSIYACGAPTLYVTDTKSILEVLWPTLRGEHMFDPPPPPPTKTYIGQHFIFSSI